MYEAKDNVKITVYENGKEPEVITTHNLVTNIGKSVILGMISGYAPTPEVHTFYAGTNATAVNAGMTTMPSGYTAVSGAADGTDVGLNGQYTFFMGESIGNGITFKDIIMSIYAPNGTEVVFARATHSAIQKNGLITIRYDWDFSWGY